MQGVNLLGKDKSRSHLLRSKKWSCAEHSFASKRGLTSKERTVLREKDVLCLCLCAHKRSACIDGNRKSLPGESVRRDQTDREKCVGRREKVGSGAAKGNEFLKRHQLEMQRGSATRGSPPLFRGGTQSTSYFTKKYITPDPFHSYLAGAARGRR